MNRPIKQIVSEVLPEFGFAKHKANNWFKSFPEVVHVIALQRADWGNYYFLNVALWLKVLGGNLVPKFHQCHLIRRLDGIALHPNELAAALNEEDYWKMDELDRQRVIRLEIGNAQFAFFRKLETVKDIRAFVTSPNEDKHVAVTRVLKEYLGVPIS